MKNIYPVISLRRFGFTYEDLPAFHAAYFMLVLIFAGIFNLGLFALLIVAHVVIDFMRYRGTLHMPFAKSAHAVVRENIADATLLLVALASTVYLHSSMPYVAVLAGTVKTRVSLLRSLLILLPKLTILHHFLRIVFRLPEYLHTPSPRMKHRWSGMEKFLIALIVGSVIALIVSPVALHLSVDELATIVNAEILPWKF